MTDCANKQTPIDHLPRGWVSLRLDDIAPLATGGTPSTRVPNNFGDDFPFVSPGDIGDSKYVCNTARRLSKTGFEQCRVFPVGSILFVSIGSTIGKCAVAPELLTTNQQINAVLPSKVVASDFLYYALCARGATIRAQAGEQAVPIVNKSQFGSTLITFPVDKDEQLRIGDALSDADALIDSLEQLLTKKRQIKQGAMQELLTGKRRLEGFQQAWRTQPFSVVLERVNAKRHQVQASLYQAVGSLPVVDQGQITPVAYSDALESRFKCPAGGVLIFGDHTCITKFVNFDFVVGADGVQVLVARQGQNTRFHAYQLELNGIESTGYNRHFKFLLERCFLCPALEEQTAIARVLCDMDADITAHESRLTKARALKQAMAQTLLTGRIRLVEPTA